MGSREKVWIHGSRRPQEGSVAGVGWPPIGDHVGDQPTAWWFKAAEPPQGEQMKKASPKAAKAAAPKPKKKSKGKKK